MSFSIDEAEADSTAVAAACRDASLAIGRQTRRLHGTLAKKRSGKHEPLTPSDKERIAAERRARAIKRREEAETLIEAAKIRRARRRAEEEDVLFGRRRRIRATVAPERRSQATAAGGRSLARSHERFERTVLPSLPRLTSLPESSLVFRIKARSLGGVGRSRWRRGELGRFGRYLVRSAALEAEASLSVFTNITQEPAGTDAFVRELSDFLVAYEDLEKAVDSEGQVYKSMIIPLPHEIGLAGRCAVASDLSATLAARGLPHLVVLHGPDSKGDQRNYHLHALVLLREFERAGDLEWSFSLTKSRDVFHPAMVKVWRRYTARLFNRELARVGSGRRYTLAPVANPSEHRGRTRTLLLREATAKAETRLAQCSASARSAARLAELADAMVDFAARLGSVNARVSALRQQQRRRMLLDMKTALARCCGVGVARMKRIDPLKRTMLSNSRARVRACHQRMSMIRDRIDVALRRGLEVHMASLIRLRDRASKAQDLSDRATCQAGLVRTREQMAAARGRLAPLTSKRAALEGRIRRRGKLLMMRSDTLANRCRVEILKLDALQRVRTAASDQRIAVMAVKSRLKAIVDVLPEFVERAARANLRRDLVDMASTLKILRMRLAGTARRIEDHRLALRSMVDTGPAEVRDNPKRQRPIHDIGAELLEAEIRRHEAAASRDRVNEPASESLGTGDRITGAFVSLRAWVDRGIAAASERLARLDFASAAIGAQPTVPAAREDEASERSRSIAEPEDPGENERLTAFDQVTARLPDAVREDLELLLAHLRIAIREKRVLARRASNKLEFAAEDGSALSLVKTLAERPGAAGVLEAIASDEEAPAEWQRACVEIAGSLDVAELDREAQLDMKNALRQHPAAIRNDRCVKELQRALPRCDRDVLQHLSDALEAGSMTMAVSTRATLHGEEFELGAKDGGVLANLHELTETADGRDLLRRLADTSVLGGYVAPPGWSQWRGYEPAWNGNCPSRPSVSLDHHEVPAPTPSREQAIQKHRELETFHRSKVTSTPEVQSGSDDSDLATLAEMLKRNERGRY